MRNKIYLATSILLASAILSSCFSYETIKVEDTSEESVSDVTTESETSADDTTTDVTFETTNGTIDFISGVSSMEAHRVASDGSDVLLYSEEYDESGNVVKHVDYKDGKPDITTLNAYDEDGVLRGRQIELTRFYYGTIDCSFQYDEAGNLLKESFTAHYDCSDTTKPSYDSEGYTEYVYENGVLVKLFDSQTDYEADEYTTTSHEEYEYDEDGQLIKTTVYTSGTNEEEVLTFRFFFEYDEEGRLIKKTRNYVGVSNTEETYEYDASGNIIKTVSEDKTIVSTYDENGRKIKDSCEEKGEVYSIEYRWE